MVAVWGTVWLVLAPGRAYLSPRQGSIKAHSTHLLPARPYGDEDEGLALV